MIGIEEIASYIPAKKISNYDRKEDFGIDNYFIDEKIGFREVAIKGKDEDTTTLCLKAFNNLTRKVNLNHDDISVLVVVTQNPDVPIPPTSAILHGKLNLPESCAAFDISHGCSGYVYGLSIIQSFMKENNFSKGVLITCDPYSKIVDPADKNTALLFGDAATATLISERPLFVTGEFSFGTVGKDYGELTCNDNRLYMNGRAVFNFTAKYIPRDIERLVIKNNLTINDIDKFIFHQGSKYIVDTISKRLKLDDGKAVFDAYEYGNTVSSSIPILLENQFHSRNTRYLVLSGFGVGLSWASVVIKRVREDNQ